ncbi:TetR family transcriptional regulator [Leucobacter luti]|uniref:TetR/AcrR family transcriptional regulator n=1 Tax=Leucobacter luti TaxID=340320 RepID=UPI0010D77663|nr:TetR/AcrR family transcriptional regulator [Leucobacter luti]MCW2288244.1 AcrR family transcriptional regulator [Leucobacter luti]TCK45598.1 TetR family transcriptional regulator [Leucobacter luti]
MTMSTATDTPGRRSGARKVRLDTEMILAAGLAVASETRSNEFSAKALGIRLGVDPSAIYRHFRSKSHLMEALLDELQQRALSNVTADPADWRDRIMQLAVGTLTAYCEHPSIAAEAMVLTTHGPGELGAIELLLDALDRAGLPAEAVVQHYGILSSYMLSTASGIARARIESGELNPENIDSPWFDGPVLADPRTHPQIARFTAQISELRDRETYLLGVNTLLDAAEQAAARATEQAAASTR